MEILVGEVIKTLRKEKGVSQETLAEKMGVSVQAVSKWECDNSYPDIILLPQLAHYFGVSMDYLFYGRDTSESESALPDDNKLRIVQYQGIRILSKETYNPDLRLMLKIDKADYKGNLNVEVWGSADIKGDVSGNVAAGDNIKCGDIGGGVNAGENVNCGNVGGAINAGENVNCGNVDGAINAGEKVNCGNVNGGVSSGGSIACGDISGDIRECGGDVHCGRISGNVSCNGNVLYEKP